MLSLARFWVALKSFGVVGYQEPGPMRLPNEVVESEIVCCRSANCRGHLIVVPVLVVVHLGYVHRAYGQLDLSSWDEMFGFDLEILLGVDV